MNNEERPDPDIRQEQEPNFTRPNIDVVTEQTWPEFAAQGVTVLYPAVPEKKLPKYLDLAQGAWGVTNVLTGDAFDEEERRPLRYQPGRGIYLRPGAWAYHFRMNREYIEYIEGQRPRKK